MDDGVAHPAAFAVAGDVKAFGVEPLSAGEFIADVVEDFELGGDVLGGEFVFSGLSVAHADDDPVVWSGVLTGARDVWAAVEAMVGQDGGPRFGGVVIFGKRDDDRFGDTRHWEFDLGGGESEEERSES